MGTSLGSLPTAGSVLGSTPGSSGVGQQRRPRQQGQPPQQGGQAGSQANNGQPPQTFAQMQQQGMARPAPPPPPSQSMSPQGSAMSAGPSSSQTATQTPPGTSWLNPTTSPSPYGQSSPTAPMPQTNQAAPTRDVNSQLSTAVSNALASPSRYDLPQVQQVNDALTSQLQQQFGAQNKQLDETLASRGLSASSVGGGYMGDLAGQQDTALANMRAGLIQNQAQTAAQDQTAALGAGQNYQNTALASQLGLGNLAVSQGNLTGVYNGQQTLGAQEAAASNALGLGGLMGSVNGQQTLGGQQLSQNQSQFSSQLAQQLGIAQMQNQTANRGVDANAALAQNQLMLQVANFLAANGYPGSTTTGTVPTTGSTGSTGSSIPSGGTSPGTTGTVGTSGNTGNPSGSTPSTAGSTGFTDGAGGGGSAASSLFPSTANASISAPGGATLDPTGTSGTGGNPYSATTQPSAQNYATPIFGNSTYTGLFGNAPVQYGATPPSTTPGTTGGTGSSGGSLFPAAPSQTGTGMTPPASPSAPTGTTGSIFPSTPQIGPGTNPAAAGTNPSGAGATYYGGPVSIPGQNPLPPPDNSPGAGTPGANGLTNWQTQADGIVPGQTLAQQYAGPDVRGGAPNAPSGQASGYTYQSWFPNVDFNKIPLNTSFQQAVNAGIISKQDVYNAMGPIADDSPAWQTNMTVGAPR